MRVQVSQGQTPQCPEQKRRLLGDEVHAHGRPIAASALKRFGDRAQTDVRRCTRTPRPVFASHPELHERENLNGFRPDGERKHRRREEWTVEA
jgi:hypothetical protein